VIDEVAVEIDVVLGGPRAMGKAEGIERMHQQHRNATLQIAGEAAFHPADLGGRAAQAFKAVRPADHDQLRGRAAIAEPRHIDEQFLPVRPGRRRMPVFRQRAAETVGGGTEFGPGARIVQRKALREIVHHDAVNPSATLAASACDTTIPPA